MLNPANQSDATIQKMPKESGVFLEQYLGVFRTWLDDPKISEICVNRPNELWIEKMGAPAMECIENNDITTESLLRLGRLIASKTDQSLSDSNPLLSAVLPSGERIQMALPPVARHGVALSIRKQVIQDLDLNDFVNAGTYNDVNVITGTIPDQKDHDLPDMSDPSSAAQFLSKAVKNKKNIIISGGTSSGKTTQLNAILKEIDNSERIITIEDTPEVRPPQANHLSFIASKGDQSIANISIQDCLEASLRFRPDRILLGELRGKEAYSYLRAVNTGHPGSITTVHADTPRGALEQITLMVMQADLGLSREEILNYTTSIIDVVIQLKRVGGKRILSDIWCP